RLRSVDVQTGAVRWTGSASLSSDGGWSGMLSIQNSEGAAGWLAGWALRRAICPVGGGWRWAEPGPGKEAGKTAGCLAPGAGQANSHSQYSSPSARHLWSLMVAKLMPWIFSGIPAMPALADWQIIQAQAFRYGPNCFFRPSDNLIRMTAPRCVTESTSKNSHPFAYFLPKCGNSLKIWET